MKTTYSFWFWLLLGAIFGSCFFMPGRARADASVYITQVQITGGTGHTADDFIELFNPNPAPFNLKGFRIVKRTATASADTSVKSWTTDTVIPPYSFYLWANSGFVGIAKTPDTTTSGTLANDNGVALRNGAENTGLLVDSVAWGAANNGFRSISAANPAAGLALVRDDIYGAFSSFTVAAAAPRNSAVADRAAPVLPADSGGQATSTDATTSNASLKNGMVYVHKSADIHISEIVPNPAGEDSGFEQVELQNDGSDPVDLQGWMLGDKDDSGMYTIAGQSILPDSVLVLTIPKDYFVMKNTGGDSVTLYYSDRTVADSVSYKDDAPEGQSYQKNGSVWVWATPSLGRKNFSDTGDITGQYKIYISEIMPNPQGADEGNEWVELYNAGDSAVSLKGFYLDNNDELASLSPAALKLGDSVIISARGYVLVPLPEGPLSLANEHDAVRLFGPDKTLLDRVRYTNAPEGQSYYREAGGSWRFGQPTPGNTNISEVPDFHLVISEILPSPLAGQDEFVEIQNTGAGVVDLKNFSLKVGVKSKILDSQVVPPGGFAVLYGSDLPAPLRNSGQTVALVDPYGRTVSSVAYEKSLPGQSYAQAGQGYVWAQNPSPGQENAVVLGESTGTVPDGASAQKSTSKTKTPTAKNSLNYEKLLNEALAANQSLTGRLDELEQKIDSLSQTMQNQAAGPAVRAADSLDGSKNLAKWYLITAFLLAVIVMLLIKVFVKIPGKQPLAEKNG